VLDIHWSEGLARAWALLDQSAGTPDADRHVVRSWLALRKHQHERAAAEAHRALELEPSNADAMEALAEAEIYAGHARKGGAEAARARRQNPEAPGRALYLVGVAAFALAEFETAVRAVREAIEVAPARQAEFSGVLAAALGQLGRTEEAHAAFRTFAEGYLERPSMSWTVQPEQFQNPRFHTWRNVDLAWAVFTHPFRDPLVQERFANGLRAAGAPAGMAGYLSLHRGNRLGAQEIEDLLFGAEIAGRDFWLAELEWRQTRSPEGAVVHSGAPIHAGPPDPPRGTGQTRDDLLCEDWPTRGARVEICVAIWRMLDQRSRLRWGDYVVVTDVGPFPFSVIR
jgi:adenylate cyclase